MLSDAPVSGQDSRSHAAQGTSNHWRFKSKRFLGNFRGGCMSSSTDTIRDLAEQDYKWGFVTQIDEDRVPKGLNEDTIRLISARKGEPEWMLEWRLNALRHWFKMEREEGEPKWANIKFGPIDYQDITYYSAPKQMPKLESLDEIDPVILKTYEK